ncbi:Tex family protein [Candidatus Laterigemmans baculatus]|uniref:Tex family protein n=1 Tax=Candidatus Laterigemmans baculatus TaxID=2770505 RepID=UPI0013DD5602|nr:Tex family protein [Candidatus Laterigemmans baculatus]
MDKNGFACFDLQATAAEIAGGLQVDVAQVLATIELLDEGNTLPFIARYRKEATRGLDEIALRVIEDQLAKARELADRKATILSTIEAAGQLTPELRRQIQQCSVRAELEDLYLPFKPKRRSRATAARERGLQPLADLLLAQRPLRESKQFGQSKQEVLRRFVDPEKEVPDEAAALAGACDIVAETWASEPATRSWMVEQVRRGQIVSRVKRGKNDPSSKFAMYFDHSERAARVASHRLLAMKRGEAEGILNVSFAVDESTLRQLQGRLLSNPQFEFAAEMRSTVEDCFNRLLLPGASSAVLDELSEAAEEEAIGVFAKNLRELLLAPPAGPNVTMGIDPGFRTGCKVAVVDGTGKVLAHTTIYPTPPRSDAAGAGKTLIELIQRYHVRMIAIGNGTASRETDAFVTALVREHALEVTKAIVSESGASIYSASELAVAEYPDLDVTVRGAISIAHRLQDPLAELVKLDPKSIGVGQYQHDVNQTRLRKSLEREVQSCVNAVGVDLNMASAPLLAQVAGIGPKLAERVVAFRDSEGRFGSRKQILKVPKFGQKAFRQAAGFLRVADGIQPLDNSAVHPESYHIVERMAKSLGIPAAQLIGNASAASKLNPSDFVDDSAGLPTIRDILAELAKPGRDPRREFKVASFTEGVSEIGDLQTGMILEGVVTNVTRFGAFVDVGVHQDGLVHISELADRYIQDPSEVVAVGDVFRVKVLEVDIPRRRIALSRKQV